MSALTRIALAVAAFAALVLALSACGPAHVAGYVPKRRDYAVPGASGQEAQAATAGSIWREGRAASMLYTDARALRENDLVVVRIEEIADAKRSADTDLTRRSELNASIEAFLSSLSKPYALKGGADTGFQGLGSTARTERLTATVPAVVRKVLPNGNLFIEGHRVVLVNAEEQHFYISGVVRPIDIDQENGVKSSMVADAEIEFTGRGVLSDNQRQGWLSRLLGWFWPF
ncbi:flagellar basal body L-ring protein FlgH [Anaeromyxobacter sp. Red801]|uniref:flagellar basal body L-ring protein FlgH n=1 Tax=Anaeromyxobacter sp. Red801 TaxID=3411632 RepID=UPI003BA2D33D